MTIEAKLNDLSAARDQVVAAQLAWDNERNLILAKVKDELDALSAEFSPILTAAQTRADELESEVKALVLAHGASVNGATLQAVYAKGRAGGWDGDKLAGYAVAHPEILKFKKPDGEPSVSFRAVK